MSPRLRAAAPLVIAASLAAMAYAGLAALEREKHARESRLLETVVVWDGHDKGEGSLREAIQRANSAAHGVRIICRVRHITPESPLPPLANTHAVVLEAEPGRCVINASRLPVRPAIELLTPGAVVSGVGMSGARGAGFLVRATNVRIERAALRDNTIGILVAEEGDGLTIRESEFTGNEVGIELTGGQHGIHILDNRFQSHRKAGIWAVRTRISASRVAIGEIARNRFTEDGYAAVFINVPVMLSENHVSAAKTAAFHLGGPGLLVRDNFITSSRAATGIYAEGTEGARIERNEIGGGGAGIQLRSAADCLVRGNRLQRNDFGLIVLHGHPVRPNLIAENLITQHRVDGIYVLGGSPVLQRNELRDNTSAGLRLVDYTDSSDHTEHANPLLEANMFAGNAVNDPLRTSLRADDRR